MLKWWGVRVVKWRLEHGSMIQEEGCRARMHACRQYRGAGSQVAAELRRRSKLRDSDGPSTRRRQHFTPQPLDVLFSDIIQSHKIIKN